MLYAEKDKYHIIDAMKEPNLREQAFIELYLVSFDAYKSAIDAGYCDGTARSAKTWVSLTGCPESKRHVRTEVLESIKEIYGREHIDKNWVIERAKLLADFTISKFLVVDEDTGKAMYDFRKATPDDWYCIEEYSIKSSYMRISEEQYVPVESVKLKTTSKIAALKLVGDHVDVAAFKGEGEKQVNVYNINLTDDDYQKVREDMQQKDDF